MALGKDHKAATRQRILTQAASRFRRDGLNAVGLRALVADAGVTHGAFYAHFPSRGALVTEAVSSALADTRQRLQQSAETATAGDKLEAVIADYLSERHRVASERGCAGAALAPEIAREDQVVRTAFNDGLSAIVELIGQFLPEGGSSHQRFGRARSVFAAMMGAMQLARTCDDERAAAPILAGGRQAALTLARQAWAADSA